MLYVFILCYTSLFCVISLCSSFQPTGEEEATNAYFELGEQFVTYNTIAEKIVYKVSAQSPFTVYVFNPDARKRQRVVAVRIDTPLVEVIDSLVRSDLQFVSPSKQLYENCREK